MGCDFNLAEREWVEEDNAELRNFLTRDEIKVQELEEENTTLKRSVEWYKNREKELLKQIEKMKKYLDCEFCKHYTESYGCKGCDETLRNKWELKENDS